MLKLKLPRWILVVMLCYSGASSSGCIDLQTSEVRQAAQRVSSINKMKILILGINHFNKKKEGPGLTTLRPSCPSFKMIRHCCTTH